jgi:exosortase A-associated hydrolase 1
VLLARRLAREGIAVMRFDYRGMGDSGGAIHSFESVVPDITAALENFKLQCPSVERVVLWGLCDAASAALLFCEQTRDDSVAGLVLLNPWIRSDVSIARAQVKHYYGQRLLEADFWKKLLCGGLDIRLALRSFAQTLSTTRAATEKPKTRDGACYQDRMATGLKEFKRPVLLVLSGDDLTAKEFADYARSDAAWREAMQCKNLERQNVADADHTFSSARCRERAEELTLAWLKRSFDLQTTGAGALQ